MLIILAFIGLCVILSMGARIFNLIGQGLDLLEHKLIERTYKSQPHIKIKTLQRIRKDIKDAEYSKAVKQQINDLTK
jgi:uncharacterized protein (DUF39 family)